MTMNESSKSHYLDMNRPGAGSSSSNEVATIPYSTFRTKIARAAKRSYASPSATGTEAKELVERNYGNGQNKEVSDVNDKFLVRHGSSGYARNVKAVNDAQDNIDMNNNSNKNQGSSMTFYGSVVLNKKTTRALNQPDGTPLYRRAMKNIVVDDSKLPADANSPVLSDKSKTLFSNNDKKSLNNGEIATQQSPEVSTLLTAYGKSIRRSYPVRGHYTKGLFNENGTKNEGSCDKDEENKAITKQFDGNDKLFNKSTSNMVRYSPTTTQATRVASSERVFIATSPLSSARFPFFTKHVVPTRSYQENNSDNSGIFRNSDNSSIFRKLDTNISTLANKSTRIDDTPEEQNNKDRTNVEGDDDITKKQNSNKPNENHCDSYCYHADDENAVTMKTIDKSKEEDQIRNYSMGELVLSEHSIEKTEAIMSPTKLLSSRSRSSLSVPDMHSENEYWNGSTAPSTKSVSTTTARITNNISPLNLHGTLSRDSDLFASISVDEELRCKDNSSGDPILSATSNAKTEEKEKQTQSKGYVLSPFSNRVTEQNGTTLFSLRSWTNSPTNNSIWNFNSLNNKTGKKSAVMIQKLDNLVQNITSEKSVESDETEEIVFMDNIEDSTPEAAANNSPTCSEIFIANQNSTSARTNAHVLYNICASASTVSDLRFAHSLINLDTASKIHGPKGKTALHAVSQNSELAKAIFKNKCDLLSSNNQNAIGRTSSPLNGIVSKGSHVSHQSNSSSSSSSYGRRISSEEEHLTEFIIDTLWNVYPAAMMTPDSKGNIPFEAALREWVNDSFERIIVGDNDHDNRANREQNVQERLPVFTNRNSSSILKSIKNTSTSIMKPSTDKLSQTVSTQGFDKHEKPLEDIEIGKRGDLEINEYNKDEASFADQPWRKLLVQLSPQALYCFSMLSSMISHMDGSIKASHRTNKVICRKKTTVNGSKNGFVATRSGRRQQSMSVLEVMTVEDLRASIIQSVASIPNIVMVVLLIDDENARKYIINTTLMQRVLASKYSIGTWLTAMLRSPAKAVSNRAIEYLQILSGPRFHFRNNGIDYSRSSTSFIGTENSIFGDGELCVVERIDKLQNRKILHTDDYNNSNNDAVLLQDDFYNKASHLPDFVPSLLSLGEKEIEEVSTTIVVRQVLDRIMARPFIVAVVFCDALFLILLIFGYHGAIQRLLLGTDGSVINYIYVANLGLFYFVVRELGKVISLYMISCCKARVYFGSFWNVADLLCIVLTLISIVLIRTYFLHPTLTINSDGDDDNNNNRNARMLMTTTDHNNIIENTATSTSTNSSIPNDYLPDGLRNLLAITTALLWLRVLNFLKGINTQLATFVLAIIQITKDILWFCVILFTLVVSFGQMFFILLAPKTCSNPNTDGGTVAAECSQSEYYLSVYAILLGDFGMFTRESFTTMFSLILAIFFTFMVVIILLNILIAIASDSYEKCLLRSQKLFGRARVMMISELVSFQNLLRRTKTHHSGSSTSLNIIGIEDTNMWNGVEKSAAWTKGWSYASVVFFTLSLLIVIVWTVAEIVGHSTGREQYGGEIWMSLASVSMTVVLYICIILVLSKEGTSSTTDFTNNNNNDWYARYVQKTMVRILGSSVVANSGTSTSPDNKSICGSASHLWNGRVGYLRDEMERIAKESRTDTGNKFHSLVCTIDQIEQMFQKQIHAMEHEIHTIRTDLTKDAYIQSKRNEREYDSHQQLVSSMKEIIATLKEVKED